MPKAAIHEYRHSGTPENEVGIPDDFLLSSPPGYSGRSEQSCDSHLSASIAGRTNARHYLRTFLLGEGIGHYAEQWMQSPLLEMDLLPEYSTFNLSTATTSRCDPECLFPIAATSRRDVGVAPGDASADPGATTDGWKMLGLLAGD